MGMFNRIFTTTFSDLTVSTVNVDGQYLTAVLRDGEWTDTDTARTLDAARYNHCQRLAIVAPGRRAEARHGNA